MMHNKITQLFEKHRNRRQGLNACLSLLELMALAQQHRGITLATKAGNKYFESRLALKQSEINESLESIKYHYSSVIAEEDFTSLTTEWQAVEKHWLEPDAFDNFLIHNFFVNGVQKLINNIIQNSELDSIPGLHQQLIHLTLRNLPEMIESVAQSRGLAVYIASTNDYDSRFVQRLQYLSQSLLDDHMKLIQELQSIDQLLVQNKHSSPLNQLSSKRLPFNSMEKQLQQQAKTLKAHLLKDECYNQLHRYTQDLDQLMRSTDDSDKTADELFRNASLIITSLYQTITKVTRGLKYSADPDLSSWINMGKLSTV